MLYTSRRRLPSCVGLAVVLLLASGFDHSANGSPTVSIAAGPMVGSSHMREVQLWLQTDRAAEVSIRYWPIGSPDEARSTATYRTESRFAYTAKPLADQVTPGTRYRYEVLLNGSPIELDRELEVQSQTLWKWRSDPPEFTVALGSCLFVNEAAADRSGMPYGGDYQIFTAIHERRPDVMLWLGDNVYMREPDWDSRTGMLYRYTHDRALPELQPLLGATHHYAIWDDHDAGPNNTHRSQWNMSTAHEAFELFWANPSFGVPGVKGPTTYFQWGDADFFLLDNRSHRTPNRRTTTESTILGEAQIEWLLDSLAASRAPFKFIAMGGQFLNPVHAHETYAHLAPGERDRLLRAIRHQGITGVIFLSGDRHHTEVSRLLEWGYPPIYDLTFSPLTAGAHSDAADEPNILRLDGTLVTERNFGLLSFSGPTGDRTLKISSIGADGVERWNRSIHELELRTSLKKRPRGATGIPTPKKEAN